ncbi:MAG: hypothetical protein LIO79_09160, partial [Rikenellaceae bacterium]|nr:hypothetical protein [Rikenellaceae bacterium]
IRYSKIYNVYENILISFLKPREELTPMIFPETGKKFNALVLTDILFTMMKKLDGVEAKILTLIFKSNGLTDFVSRRGAKGGVVDLGWALNVFSRFPARISSIFTLGHYMYDSNRDIRMFALIAFFEHDPARIALTLKNYHYKLMPRDYANIYDFAVRNSIDPAIFELLLKSKNRSVVNFGRHLLKLNGLKS